jgi:hypothetical protein
MTNSENTTIKDKDVIAVAEKNPVNPGTAITSILPTYKMEYTDGTNWFSLATENYVNMVQKSPCVAATTGVNLSATYVNGTAGVGATLTSTVNQIFTIDGVTPTVGSRILVKDQTTTFQNGIYTLTNAGSATVPWVLTRATDYDSLYQITQGDEIRVATGTLNAVTSWMQTAVVATIGTSAITFTLLSKAGVTSVTGTTNQITVTGTATAPIVGIASNPIIPGTAAISLPGGSLAQRPASPTPGSLRFNNGT